MMSSLENESYLDNVEEENLVNKKPALMLPMGKDDYINGGRMHFLRSCAPVLETLGWTVGVEFKGSNLGDYSEWGERCAKLITALGGRLTWHLPPAMTKNLNEGTACNIRDEIVDVVRHFRFWEDIEAVTIHCAPAISVEPDENAGNERYNSPIGAAEMLAHIKAQVEPLKELNELLGGKLHIENVDLNNFRDGGTKMPTFLALQTGSWLDLRWLKIQSGVNTTCDSEHFFGAECLLNRLPPFDEKSLPIFSTHAEDLTDEEHELAEIANYFLEKGKTPLATSLLGFYHFCSAIDPKLFHIGGSVRPFDTHNRITTHLPNFEDAVAWKTLEHELRWIADHPKTIGGVIEVCGNLQPERFSEWSPRPHNDEVAKMQTYLTVINEIETLQKKK